MYGLEGRACLVTGAAQGIGREVARRLAAEGMSLALVDIQAEKMAELAPQLGEGHLALAADVADPGAVDEAVARAAEALGRIDGLVNAAGVSRANDFLRITPEEWDRILDVNLRGTFLMCRAVGRHLVRGNSGSIVNVASIAGKSAAAHLAHYSASKGGVILLTQAVAQSMGPAGVRVNAVCPGMVWTPMFEASATWLGAHSSEFQDRGLSPREIYEEMARSETALRQPTEASDVAALVAFLLSDEAASITGQAINVDGGMEFH